jgi:hypothetical protein
MDMAAATAPGRSWRETFKTLGDVGRDVILDRDAQKKEQQLAAGEIKILTGALNYLAENAPEQMKGGLTEMRDNLNDQNIPQDVRVATGRQGVQSILARLGQQQKFDAALEKKKQLEADKAFRTWFTTSQPGQLTPEGEELARGFRESRGDALSKFEGFMERMGGRPISADQREQFLREQDVREEERLAQERGPSGAPSQAPSARFRELAAKADLPPLAGMRAWEIDQLKVAQEQAAATARLAATSAGLDIGRKKVDLATQVPEAVNKLVRQGVQDYKLDEVRALHQAYDQFVRALDDGQKSTISANIARNHLARMLQPTGILTDSDINRVGAEGALMDRIDQLFADTQGELTEPNYKAMLKAANALLESAQDNVKPSVDAIIRTVTGTYKDLELTEEDVLERSMLKEYTQFPWQTEARGWDVGDTGGGSGDLTTPSGDFKIGTVIPLGH